MRLLDWSFPSPAENLALDEVILDGAESGAIGETLRFWESPVSFVVLGVSQKLAEEVHEDACRQDGVPILRRCSAGGCVLQGPGCLNFALALTYQDHPEVRTLRESYCYILNAVCDALKRRGVAATHNGISDMVWDGCKISGNAQKRRRQSILHHGTLLYRLSAADMGRYLREPKDRPEYRGDRSHGTFVRCVSLHADELRAVVCEAFSVARVSQSPQATELEQVARLAREKYSTEEWIRRR